MNTIQKYYALLLLMVVLCTSCYKDHGNYDYKGINDIAIKIVTDSISINQFDTLRLSPEVTQFTPAKGTLKYEWYAFGDTVRYRLLSTEEQLKAPISLVPYSGYYSVVFKVTDTTTGVSTTGRYHLKVTTALAAGWLTLEQKGGSADVSLITPGNRLLLNIYSTANNGATLPADASKLYSVNYNAGGKKSQSNFMLDANNVTLVDQSGFLKIAGMKELFYVPPAKLKPEYFDVDLFGSWNIMINDGGFYFFNMMYGEGKYGDRLTVSSDYHLPPYVANGFFINVYYDQKNHRFLNFTGFDLATYPANEGGAFDLNNVPGTLRYMASSVNGSCYAILKDDAKDQMKIYTIVPGGAPTAEAHQVIANSPDMPAATGFAFSQILPLVYYSVGNKLYLYDVPANKSRVVYEFPANETITVLKMQHIAGYFDLPKPGDDRRLIIATYNGTTGTAYYLDLANTGDIANNTYTHKFEGLGKVMDMAYKKN
jgi:hypothetical protein